MRDARRARATRPRQAPRASRFRARAPVRLDLAGGWTDVPPFSEQEGGAVVNLTINRYSYVTVSSQPRGVSLVSADYGTRVHTESTAALLYDGELDLLKASIVLALPANQSGGLEVFARCEAPPGSGTGGSGSMGVALAGALAAWHGERLAPHEAALRAWRAERQELGVAGGTQDQFAAAYGGANYMEFREPAFSVSPLRLSTPTVAELEKRLVLCYTGVSRLSGDVVDAVMGAYRAGAARTISALRTIRRLADDVKTLLLSGDVDALGQALADNWRCQRDLHPSVSNDNIEYLCACAAAAGARGAKALGAGGGGCLLFLAAADREHEVQRALADAGAQLLDFGLEWQGLQVWEAARASAA